MVINKDYIFSKNKPVDISILSFMFSIFTVFIDSMVTMFDLLFNLIAIDISIFSINNSNTFYNYGNKD